MAETVSIERQFRGPPQSGHGGYTCGLVGRRIDAAAAEVTLRVPPPLQRPLAVERPGPGQVELRDADTLVAEGRALEGLELQVPEPVGLAEAAAAREASPLHHYHPWPMCFVCGPDRELGDGLRVISGPVEGRDIVASPWETGEDLPTENGALAPEMVWAALDCPSGNALMQVFGPPADSGESEGPRQPVAALGRLSARIDAAFEPGVTYAAVGWPIEREGRKHYTGSAIFSPRGELLACAKAVWIELRGDTLGAQS